ncbi:MAG TPA: ATP-binding protein [Candidatus Bacteroides pullicola]|uniref:histidine kinase n=1 Tax=Candidatus Bacteroides pullicola TaxID=2838475 RepID=A0A9D1ZJ33_9BACE|nr:ATP-binding protein [Candidatus Bacteroides pullicola]
MQTPLAVFQTKLDLLLQQPDLTRRQAELIQGLYEDSNRLARLNRNLLLLAKIDNRQYGQMEDIRLTRFLDELTPFLQSIAGDLFLYEEFTDSALTVRANRTLLESLVNNLVVNAVRHNRPKGEIYLLVSGRELTVSNTSDEPALDARLIFNRFYRPSEKVKGNGLGLAIVRAICEYHGWTVAYRYEEGMHRFTVRF